MIRTPSFSLLKKILPLALILAFLPANAQRVAPARVQVALFAKLLAFYTNLGTDEFIIHVVDSPSVAKEFKKIVGLKIGNATLAGISESDGIPENGARVIYLSKMNNAILNHAHTAKLLTITGTPNLVSKGITLGLGVEAGKTKILLNLTTTKAEGVIWNPAILRVSEQVK